MLGIVGDVGGQCDSCTGTGTGGYEVEKDGPVWATKFVVGVGKVGTSRRDPEGVGTAGGELARDERVGGDDELMVVGNEVVGGHEECKADGCPKR